MIRNDSSQVNKSRRKFLALGAGAFVVAVVPWKKRNRPQLIRRSIAVMGTVGEIAVVDTEAQRAYAAIEEAVRELQLVEQTMSRFLAHSDIGRINSTRTDRAVHVTRATGVVVEEALEWAHASDGRFDPALGRAAMLWDVTNRSAPPPSSEVSQFADREFYRSVDVEMNDDGAVVVVSEPDVALDLGGIAKGYGVDRAVESLRRHGVSDGLVNIGGDLFAMGRSENGDPWRVGVRDAADPARVNQVLAAEDVAVATSGDYLKFFTHGGRRYHHLLDPETGTPRASELHSVTVVAGKCVTADACATAVFGMKSTDAKRLASSRGAELRVIG